MVVWPALRFNALVLGFSQPLSRAEISRRLGSGPAPLAPLRRLLDGGLQSVVVADRPWTDDRAPVEWATDRMLAAFVTRGGTLDEDLLPTAP